MVDWLSKYSDQSLILTLLTPILVIIGFILPVIMVIWLVARFVSVVKEGSRLRRLSHYRCTMQKKRGEEAKNNLSNAKKLLGYFQQWAAHTGGETPEAVEEMETIIRSYEKYAG